MVFSSLVITSAVRLEYNELHTKYKHKNMRECEVMRENNVMAKTMWMLGDLWETHEYEYDTIQMIGKGTDIKFIARAWASSIKKLKFYRFIH